MHWLALGLLVSAAVAAPALAQSQPDATRKTNTTSRVIYPSPTMSSRTINSAPRVASRSAQPEVIYEGTIPPGAIIEGGSLPNSTTSPTRSPRAQGKPYPTSWERLKFKWQNYWKPGLQESHWGYPEEFGERPLGASVYATMRTHVANGEAARMVLMEYDFESGGSKLNYRGLQQLGSIAYMLPRNFFPVIIEQSKTGNPELDAQRRQEVLNILAQAPFPVAPERILVANPIPAGMDSPQPSIVYDGLLGSVRARGAFPTFDISAGGSTSGTSGVGTGVSASQGN